MLTWLNRGTLHLVAREDYPLLQALIAPRLRAGSDYSLARHGIDPDTATRAVRLVDRILADDGPQTRHALRERLLSADVPADGQGLVYVLYRASVDGVLVRGPVDPDGAEQLFARVADWLPEAPGEIARLAAVPERGYTEIARRYLIGHGPADAEDLAKWLSLPVGQARTTLAALDGELRQLEDGMVELIRGSGGIDRVGPLPPPRLLGVFEPLLMGWRSRALVLGEHEGDVVSGGIFRGMALVDGRAAGSWKFAGRGIDLTPFGELSPEVADVLSADGEAVRRFLGRS